MLRREGEVTLDLGRGHKTGGDGKDERGGELDAKGSWENCARQIVATYTVAARGVHCKRKPPVLPTGGELWRTYRVERGGATKMLPFRGHASGG